MNTTTAATEAQVTIATIRTWCRRGVIAATKVAGRWVIDSISLAHRIAISAWKRPTRTEATPVIDLNATYTHTLLPGEEPEDFTVKVKERTTRDGEHLISVRGLIPLFADRFDAITDAGDRMACLNKFISASIVISDRADADWDDCPEARESGRLRTTYCGGVPGITVADVLDLASQIRAQLAA